MRRVTSSGAQAYLFVVPTRSRQALTSSGRQAHSTRGEWPEPLRRRVAAPRARAYAEASRGFLIGQCRAHAVGIKSLAQAASTT